MSVPQFRTNGEKIAFAVGRIVGAWVRLIVWIIIVYVTVMVGWNVAAILNKLFGGLWL